MVKMNLPMKEIAGGRIERGKGRSGQAPPALQPTALNSLVFTLHRARGSSYQRVEGDDGNGGMEDGEVVNGDEGEGRATVMLTKGKKKRRRRKKKTKMRKMRLKRCRGRLLKFWRKRQSFKLNCQSLSVKSRSKITRDRLRNRCGGCRA